MTVFEVPGPFHRLWTPDHSPVLSVGSGDEIIFDVPEASDGQFSPPAGSAAIEALDWERLYPLIGPILVDGAEPGDTLEIEMLDLRASTSSGWTAVHPGLGLLPDQFPNPHLHQWNLNGASMTVDFMGVADVPIRPFCGVIGVCPDTSEPLSVLPPGRFGGNLDCRDLTVGASLFLPVQLPGARLSIGDPHVAQGDGEVCSCAIESSLSCHMRITLHKGRRISSPHFQTAGLASSDAGSKGYYATCGVAPDLMEASRCAVSAMVDHLVEYYGLDAIDAYVLCSVAVGLRISEVVDVPNWVVSAYLPLSIMT